MKKLNGIEDPNGILARVKREMLLPRLTTSVREGFRSKLVPHLKDSTAHPLKGRSVASV